MTDPSTLRDLAIAILRDNDRGGYTVPTSGLYPYQWNWDSGFAALGFSTFDEPRAWQELETLMTGQWDDGMVPHIVFHQFDDSYFPGPAVWGVDRDPPTTGITQPPILATMVLAMLDRARDTDQATLKSVSLYPRLLAWHRWWWSARDPENTGLVRIYHPWESGRDNSPDWDEALARVEATEMAYQRRDLNVADAEHRPHKFEYDRYLNLVGLFRSLSYEPAALAEKSPFQIVDAGINAILHRADKDLLTLAERLDIAEGQDDLRARIRLGDGAFEQLWSEKHGIYCGYDLVADALVQTQAVGGLLPLFADLSDQSRSQKLIDAIGTWSGQARWGVPSVPPLDASFEAKRYWRGPVWGIVNWMLVQGLMRRGETALADRLWEDFRGLVEQTGFFEYYSPLDGSGCGGAHFTWTAAVYLYWSAAGGRAS